MLDILSSINQGINPNEGGSKNGKFQDEFGFTGGSLFLDVVRQAF
jgi:hypothetical protein